MRLCANIDHATELAGSWARFAFIEPRTIANQIVGYSARFHRLKVVNLLGCAHLVDSCGNDNRVMAAGAVSFEPAPQSETCHCVNSDTPLAPNTDEAASRLGTFYHRISPSRKPSLSERETRRGGFVMSQVKTPSHEVTEEFVQSITSHTPLEARQRMAEDTRRVLAQIRLRSTESLDDNDAETLRCEIEKTLPHIHADDLFSLMLLCYRFALCPPEAVH